MVAGKSIPIRFSEDLIAEVDIRAKAAGLNRSEMIRQLVMAAIQPDAPWTRSAATVDIPEPTVTVVDDPAMVHLGGGGSYVPEPGAETPPQQLITPDSTEVDAAVARHPAGKRRHNGKRTDLRTAGSCHGCRDCTGWSPIVAGGMRCKCGHPVHMH